MAAALFKDLKEFRRARAGSGRMHGMFTPRNTSSVIFSKGLLNAPGDNNCFLNSAVQVLWHLDVFRRSFRDMNGHACMGKACIFCALKALFNQLQNSEEDVLPPDALRKALATAFKDQLRFQLGCMDDAAECFENILVRIHFHLAHNIKEDLCDARHCIPHRKFAMTLIEHSVCSCGATSEPFPFTQMVHYVTSAALCSEAQSLRKNRLWPNTDHFGSLLRKAGAIGDVRDCPSACGRKINIRRILMNCPDVVSIGLIWDSDKPDIEHISNVICNLGTTIQLRELFDDTVDDRAKANSLFLVGIVTYYGRHYTTFFYNTNRRYWVYFDDAVVKMVGPNWSDVVDRCRRGHFQPLLLLYAYPEGKTVSNATAPKRKFLLKGYDDKENEIPIVPLNNPNDSLSSKVSEILVERDEPVSIKHYHGNSDSSTTSGLSASSNDSQSTLVYKPVGAVPEFQASSEPTTPPRTPPKEVARGDGRSSAQDWQMSDDGSVVNAVRASWIPNSVVEIGHDALHYVPLKKNGGSYAISQFALQENDDGDGRRRNDHRTMPARRGDYVKEGHSVKESDARNPYKQTDRPSSAKDMTSGRVDKVPMSPQQTKRPSSAQQVSRSQPQRQAPNSVPGLPAHGQQQRMDGSGGSPLGGAVYNAKTGVISGHSAGQTPTHNPPPLPSLSFNPYGNFSTEVEQEYDATRRKLDIKALDEFGDRRTPQEPYRSATPQVQQNPARPVSREGSWSSASSKQFVAEPSAVSTDRNSSVQRASSLNIKPLEKYQDSHSSVPDLKNAANNSVGFSTGQYPKFSSVPDLQEQTGFGDGRDTRKHSHSDPIGMEKSMKRSVSSDGQLAPGSILAEAIRNRESASTAIQHQDQHHIPLMRSSSVTNRNPEEKQQARAKYNIQSGFLTLPGKKRANQFKASGRQGVSVVDGGRPINGGSGGTGYALTSGPHPDGQQRLQRQHSIESRSSVSSSHQHQPQEGMSMRQTPEVSVVTKGLDIDSIASRDSGYRSSRDRSSASSGSVYSFDGHLSDNAPTSVSTTATTSTTSGVGNSSQHHDYGRSQTPQPRYPSASQDPDTRSLTTGTAQPQQRSPTPDHMKTTRTSTEAHGSDDVAFDLVKGVEEQLLASKKAEEDRDLALALALCSAAASTLKIALRLDNLKDQTRLFLQTKYNTTVLKSRGLHRRLTLLRRSEEEVADFRSAPPPPPIPDHHRSPNGSVAESHEAMSRHEKDSLQEIELLKKRVDDLYAQQERSRRYNHQTPPQQPGTANQAPQNGYQPRQYQSVPSSPTTQRGRATPNRDKAPSVNTGLGHGVPSDQSHHQYRPSDGRVGVHHSGSGAVQGAPQAPQRQPQGSAGHQNAWGQMDGGRPPAGHGTAGRATTPLGFSTSMHQQSGATTTTTTNGAQRYQGQYRSQTPTPYMGSAKPSERSFAAYGSAAPQMGATGNRNNNATGVDQRYQPDNHNWVQRREQPRPERADLAKPTMSDTTTCIKSDDAVPQPQGVRTGKRRSQSDLIDLS